MKKLHEITSKLEDRENKETTNIGFIIDTLFYEYGEYIISEGITTDVDGDKIIEDVLYVYGGDNKYYKVGDEDLLC